MKDIDLASGVKEFKTASDRAVMYFLRRMCHDGRLCWYMNGTGAYEHMLEAGAEIRGISVEEFTRDHNKHKAKAYDPAKAACRECERVDPDEGAPDCGNCLASVPALLSMAVKLIMEMSRHASGDPAISERIEIFFESIADKYPDFKWSQCAGVYSGSYREETFKRSGDGLVEDW